MEDINYTMVYLFILPIAILYGYFFSRLHDYLYDYDGLDKSCKSLDDSCGYIKECSDKERKLRDECHDDKSDKMKKYNEKKFIMMLTIGFIGIIFGLGIHMKYYSGITIQNPAIGIAFGGLITVLYYLLINWFRIGTLPQLITIGLLLGGFIGSSFMLTHK